MAVSSSGHFNCLRSIDANQKPCGTLTENIFPAQALPDLVGVLSGRVPLTGANPAVADRFVPDVALPEVILSVRSSAHNTPGYNFLLERIAQAVDPSVAAKNKDTLASSSIWGLFDTDPPYAETDNIMSIKQLEDIARDRSSSVYSNRKPDVFSVWHKDDSLDKILRVAKQFADLSDGQFAMVWAVSRADDGTENAKDSATKSVAEGAAAAANVEEKTGPKDDEDSRGTQGDQADTQGASSDSSSAASNSTAGRLPKTTSMDPPELSAAVLAGLLVGLILLAIFVPGMLCLWNIQPPQTFESFEKDEAKKKMQ